MRATQAEITGRALKREQRALKGEERVGAKALGQEWVWHVRREREGPYITVGVVQSRPVRQHVSVGSL